jgi:hypothetical protein
MPWRTLRGLANRASDSMVFFAIFRTYMGNFKALVQNVTTVNRSNSYFEGQQDGPILLS